MKVSYRTPYGDKMILPIILATAIISTTTPQIIEQRVEPIKAELTEKEKIVETINSTFGEDASLMIRIAKCESELRQTKNGKPLISKTGDHGVLQINKVHIPEAKRRGLDLDDLEDNVKFAKILFDQKGTKDWRYSRDCWK